jgi:hypothetical protein
MAGPSRERGAVVFESAGERRDLNFSFYHKADKSKMTLTKNTLKVSRPQDF